MPKGVAAEGHTGRHFGPNFNRRVLDSGGTWKDLQKFTREISDGVFISRNLDELKNGASTCSFTRALMTWSPSTWLGRKAPPIHSGLPRSQLGARQERAPEDRTGPEQQSRVHAQAFLSPRRQGDLPAPPQVQHTVKGKTIEVTVTFPKGSNEESGRIWWIFERAPDGSPKYLTEMIPDEQTMEMTKQGRSWSAAFPEPTGQTHRFLQQPSENPAVRGIALPILPFQARTPG